MLLPSPHDAAAWFVETAHAAMARGERLDAAAARLLIALAPDNPLLATAIENLELGTGSLDPRPLVAHAHAASESLRRAIDTRDEALARGAVTSLEEHVLRVYRPAHGVGSFEDDVAVAGAMLDAYDVGQDPAHLMMAEELMLVVLRRDWARRASSSIAANCEAALVLGRLAERTEKPEYRERAIEALHLFADSYREHGLAAAPYVSALQMIR